MKLSSAFKRISNGPSIRQHKISDGLPVSRIETIAGGTIDFGKCGYAGLAVEGNERWLLNPGDILFSHINSPQHVGRCALYEAGSPPLFHGMNLLRLEPNLEILHPRFALWLLRSRRFRSSLRRFVNQAVNQASVSITNLKSIDIDLPALSEQRRIADILDKTDDLRAKRREAIAHLDSLTQSIFHEMFGVSDDQLEWRKVRDAGRVQLGRQRAPKYQTGEHDHPYMRVANVHLNELSLDDVLTMDFDKKDFEAYKLNFGDLLLNEGQSTELVGRPAMWRNEIADCCFQNTLVRFIPQVGLTNPEYALGVFVKYFHDGEFAKISSKTSNVAHLGATRFADMPFPLAPLDLQNEYAERVAAVADLKGKHHAQLAELDALFASLQDRAFKGEQ